MAIVCPVVSLFWNVLELNIYILDIGASANFGRMFYAV